MMYERFYGLSRLPFQLLPDPDFFYRSREHDKALTSLEYGIFERAGFIVITGEIGTGKTTLLRNLLRSLDKDIPIALLNQTFLSPMDFLRTLCQEFSLPHEAKKKSELIELFGSFLVEKYQEGRYVILILDEAQNLPLDTLEEIRMLSNLDADNERLLQIILVGQPSLRGNLRRKELRQLLQRVEVSYHLKPLDRAEIQEYIYCRLDTAGANDPNLFTKSAIEAIFDYTKGIPRLINLICHRCLVYGFADSRKKINQDLLEQVLESREAEGLYPEPIVESPNQNQEVTDKPSDIYDNSETVTSQAQVTAALNRLTEISGASFRAVELAAAKAANRTDEDDRVLLSKQLGEERKFRQALEHRLSRAEDDLARLVKVPQKIIDEEQHRNSADTDADTINPSRTGIVETYLSLFSVKPNRRNIFLLVCIIFIFSFASLAFWRPIGKDINEQATEHNSEVSRFEIPQPKNKPEENKQSRTPSKIPLTADANSTGQDPEAQTSHSGDYNSQTDISKENNENLQSPVKIEKYILTVKEPALSPKNIPKTYVCIVKLANVRDGPGMQAPVIWRIAQGTEVEVIGEEGNWMQLKSEVGQSAWIYRTLLARKN
jgi:general secretion pathway protein A